MTTPMPTGSPPRPPLPPEPLPSLLARYAGLVRGEMSASIPDASGALHPFYGMIAYHLGWVDRHFAPQTARAGKNLRPSLCLLLAEGLGGRAEDAAPLAAGIELLHNFSLVHDDIEDRSATRRDRPTVWSVWGEAQAINTGDAMFSLSHQLWLRTPLADRDPAAFVEILRSLERTVLTLCEGQYLDMSGEGSLDLSSDAYLMMIAGKTAALIGESAWVGTRVGTADPVALAAARRFGVELGTAFQIRDDLLGIWGDERETGKSASSDIATRKMTLPVILALESDDAALRQALRARYGALPTGGDDDTQVRALLEAAGAQEHTAQAEHAHWAAAMDALERVPLDAQWREAVCSFARSFIQRTA